MRTREDFNQDNDPVLVALRGMIRRVAVTLTAKALWQLAGFRMPDGSIETMNAEPFTGIGIYARPPSSGKPEAIAVMVNGPKSPAIIGVRDEATRAAIAGALQPDETMLFNSQAMLYLKADGTVEARSKSGTAQRLLTEADAEAFKAAITGWVPVATDGGAALKVKLLALFTGPPAWPAYTTKLKGE